MAVATVSCLLYRLNVEGRLIRWWFCYDLAKAVFGGAACETAFWLVQVQSLRGSATDTVLHFVLRRLFRVHGYRGALLCLSNDSPPLSLPCLSHSITWRWPHLYMRLMKQSRPIEVCYLCSVIRHVRVARPGGDCISKQPTCYETRHTHTDSGAPLSFAAPTCLVIRPFHFPWALYRIFSPIESWFSRLLCSLDYFCARCVHVCKHFPSVCPWSGRSSSERLVWLSSGNLISSPSWSHLTYCCYYWYVDPL